MSDPLALVFDPADGAAARELYGIPPGEFVAARTELQRAMRAIGRRDLAAAIGRLQRPTVAEHALNLAVRAGGEDLVDDLRRAQVDATAAQAAAITGDPDGRTALRAATTAVRAARAALVRAAAATCGAGPNDARTAEIDAVVQRVVTAEAWPVLAAGVLGVEPMEAGAGAGGDEPVFVGIPDDIVIPASRRRVAPVAPSPAGEAADDATAEVARLEQELAVAAAACERARDRLVAADRALAEAVEAQQAARDVLAAAEVTRDDLTRRLDDVRGRGHRSGGRA